jgi:hypothetical protein
MKGAYAIILAMNGNNIEEARRLKEIACRTLANGVFLLHELSMIVTAYIHQQQKIIPCQKSPDESKITS